MKPSRKSKAREREIRRPDFDHAEELRSERRAAKTAADLFVRACQTGDLATFFEAVDRISRTVDGGWLAAMRKVAKEVRVVNPEIQSAFRSVWIESKMLPLTVGDHRALCDAARLSLPHSGPAVRLFRGAGAFERRRGIYGPSRSADAAAAERFALGRRVMDGGSVLLETLAPRAAIISAIDDPPPPTRDEIHDLKRECLDLVNDELVIDEFHDEREYVVDRRYLNAVTVVRRYEQIHFADAPPISTAAVSQ
jgi:hypothetical protein